MSAPLSAKQRLSEELSALRQQASKPKLAALAARAKNEYGLVISDSSLSEWFSGRSAPTDDKRFGVVVMLLTGKAPNPDLRRLHRQAWEESIRRRSQPGAHTSSSPARPRGKWLPRFMEVHYANLERIAELLAIHSSTGHLPLLPAGLHPTIGHVESRQILLRALERLDLPTKRYTSDFTPRSLDSGDLLVFDTYVRTRNGPQPGVRKLLTGDLNQDPHVYLQRAGVRVLMPIDPKWVTTDTAHGEFSSGGVHLAGVCVVKGRVHPADAE